MSLPFFGSKDKTLLGVDIGTSSLKMVELASTSRGLKLVAAVSADIPPDLMQEGKISDPTALSNVLRKAVASSRSKTKNVAFSVPGSAVITRILDMPTGLNEEEMEVQLLMEAEQYIPYSLDEVAVDFNVLGAKDDSDQVQVLLAACRKDSIDALVDVAEAAELTPKIVDVGPFCLERAYPLIADQLEEDSDGIIACVDIGAVHMRFNVLERGKTVYSREELFGSGQLTDEIQRRYGLSRQESSEAQSSGGLPPDYEEEVLSPFRSSLVQQVSRALQFFYSSTTYNHVDCVVLGGGILADESLVQLTEDKIEVPVMAANPFANMDVDNKINSDALRATAPSMLVATVL